MANKTVLIVDDAAETRIFLKGIVTSMGLAFFEAKSGIDALKILNEHMIDLVILDVLMPHFDGYQTLEFINKLKQKQNIKVVFLSGKKGDLDQDKIAALKPDDLIHKTVDIHVLKNKLRKILDGTAPPPSFAAASTTPPAASPAPTTTAPTVNAPKPAAPNTPSITPKPAPAGVAPQSGATTSATTTAPTAATPKLDLPATITNMPIVLDIKIIKITQSGIVFQAKHQFKEGALLSVDCPKAASSLKKTGELQLKVQKSVPENDYYIVTTMLS
ncbi:response regulator [Silvanigrella aquatica]|uniref:Response regulatory domain-containing protein n=1 Tax=Silvanigrella aquatica TaxID=1915309 RepID=A0A1L4D2H0_9BACT|nr:response regulator [Silvanigrella aquatica]APJ04387.1 hypothetical protein AXG55_10905 [Silvanigrella aquatica]